MLEQFISATAWRMTPPTAYGPFHLLFLVLGIGGCAVLAHALRGRSEPRCRRILLGVGLFLMLCGVAFCINLAFFRESGGTINMFFVGPANNSIIVFRDIASRFGWYSATALYIPCVCFGAWLVYIAVRRLTRKSRTAL